MGRALQSQSLRLNAVDGSRALRALSNCLAFHAFDLFGLVWSVVYLLRLVLYGVLWTVCLPCFLGLYCTICHLVVLSFMECRVLSVFSLLFLSCLYLEFPSPSRLILCFRVADLT